MKKVTVLFLTMAVLVTALVACGSKKETTFIAIEAKEGKGEDIEAALTTYRTNLIEDSFMYPMNIAKVNSSKVIREGDYVFLLMLGKIDERAEVTEEEAFKFAEEEVAKVENIINDFLK